MDDLRPVRRVVVVDFLVTVAGHARDYKTELGVRLVLALCVQIEEYGTVCIVDWFKADPLAIVLVIFFIFVDCPQSPCSDATTHRLFESIVVGFISHRCLLISSVQAIADLGQLVVLCPVFAHIIDCDAVVSVFVDDTDDRQHDLVDFEFRLVFVLVI